MGKDISEHNVKTIIPEGNWNVYTEHPHIPFTSVQKVKNFKYRGDDRSYLYVYFYSPMADWVAGIWPKWLAPNVITLAGFVLTIVSHILLIYYQGFGIQGPIPEWLIVMTGVFYVTYTLLDNVDGKQARRTGSSSVLGMLLDHGWDAYTSMFMIMNICKILQLGNTSFGMFPILIASVPFYFATLESYYIGGVFLPEINACTDGSIIYLLVCIGAAIQGYEWLITPIFLNFTIAEILVLSTMIAGIIFSCLNIKEIFTRQDRVRPYDLEEVMRCTLLALFISLTCFVCPLLTPGNLSQTPMIPQYLYGILLVRPITFMQLYLVTDQPLFLMRRTMLLSLIILWATTAIGIYYKFAYWQVAFIYSSLILINFIAAFHMLYFTFTELSTILNVSIFTIPYQKEEVQSELITK
jgi:ethanolaminephosphotransferase